MQNHSSPEPLNTNSTTEDEISLANVLQFFKDGKYWIISLVGICTLLGATYASLAPSKYEASASIEMATVAGKPIEDGPILVEKLKLPMYFSKNTFKACKIENVLPSPGAFLATQLNPVANKNAPIVTIRFKGGAADDARICLESVVAEVANKQNTLLTPILNTQQSQLQALQQKLEASEKLVTLLPVKDGKFVFDDAKFSGSALLLALLLTKESEIKELRNEINEMQISLSPPKTQGTTLVTPIYAPDVKVEPRRARIILISAIGGLILGVFLFALRKDSTSKREQQ